MTKAQHRYNIEGKSSVDPLLNCFHLNFSVFIVIIFTIDQIQVCFLTFHSNRKN